MAGEVGLFLGDPAEADSPRRRVHLLRGWETAPLAQLSETPGRIGHLGQALGAENDAVYGELLGIDADRIAALRLSGVI